MDDLLTTNDVDTIARAHRRCREMEVERTNGNAAGAGEHLPRHPGLVCALPDPDGTMEAGGVHHKIF